MINLFAPTTLGYPARRAVIALALGVVALLLFVALSDAVINTRPVLDLDAEIERAVRDAGETPVTNLFDAITLLGGPGIWVIGLGVGAALFARRQWSTLAMWALAIGVGKLVNVGLKDWFERPRPLEMFSTSSEEFGYPSGHVMMSMIAYGLLAVLIWRVAPSPLARSLALKLAGTIIILVAVSRVVLGMHYLSDVLGGLIAGGLWLAACAAALVALGTRRAT